jgi:hypothetical protein
MKFENQKWAHGKILRLLIVVSGVVLGQAILYGPSLIGQRILLPLDLLARPGMYIPRTAETAKIVPHNFMLADLIDQVEPARRFGIGNSSRPFSFVGAISIRRRSFVWPKYSLFLFWKAA